MYIKEEAPISTTDTSYRKYVPILTAVFGVATVLIFIGIHLQGNVNSWETLEKWGAPSAEVLFDHAWWGLITSNFVHVEVWHIGFNLYWFWQFGKKIEFESNTLFYAVFILTAAMVSSLAQLAFDNQTGIGLSGVGYAMFGFLFVKSKTTEAYKNALDKSTIRQFLVWLVVCVVLTQTGVMNIGNAAHTGGMLWGALLAYISRFKPVLQYVAGLGFIGLLWSLIYFGTFSDAYHMYRMSALEPSQHREELAKDTVTQQKIGQLQQQLLPLQAEQKYDEGTDVCNKILELDPEDVYATEYLRIFKLSKLQMKAQDLHTKKKYAEARKVYQEILAIDKDNVWARDALNALPTN